MANNSMEESYGKVIQNGLYYNLYNLFTPEDCMAIAVAVNNKVHDCGDLFGIDLSRNGSNSMVLQNPLGFSLVHVDSIESEFDSSFGSGTYTGNLLRRTTFSTAWRNHNSRMEINLRYSPVENHFSLSGIGSINEIEINGSDLKVLLQPDKTESRIFGQNRKLVTERATPLGIVHDILSGINGTPVDPFILLYGSLTDKEIIELRNKGKGSFYINQTHS